MKLIFCLFIVVLPLAATASSEIVNCEGNTTCGTETGCHQKETALRFVVVDDDRILVQIPGSRHLKETKSIEEMPFFYWEDNNIVNSIISVKDYVILTQIVSNGNAHESFITELQCGGR